jgi:hypothetical protein
MEKFVELEKYGQLYLDRVLFESYYPIIFICKNDKREIFICVCCQNNKKGIRWLIGKTSTISIVKMLEDKITIRQLLLDCSIGRISVYYDGSRYNVEYNNSDWDEDSEYLPKKNSYICADDVEFDDDIRYFLSVEQICC